VSIVPMRALDNEFGCGKSVWGFF